MIERWLDSTSDASPGWADRLSAAIAARSIPEQVVYSLAWLVLFAAITAVEWSAGAYAPPSLLPLHAVLAAGVVVPVYLVRIFNRSAVAAMVRVRPLLAVDDAYAEIMTRRLTSTPFRLEVVVVVFWLAVTIARIWIDPSWWKSLQLALVAPAGAIAVLLILAFVISVATLGVKIAYMGTVIWHISQRELSVSIWELGPLHGFSILTAQFAGTLMALAVAIYAARPELLKDALGIASGLFGVFFAGAIFVVPLLGIHNRLVSEKGRLRGEAAKTMEAAIRGLHLAIETSDVAAMDAHYKAVAAVEIELRTLSAIPTWPWLPDTFRWVVGALMFPLVLFVIQFVITQIAAAGPAQPAA